MILCDDSLRFTDHVDWLGTAPVGHALRSLLPRRQLRGLLGATVLPPDGRHPIIAQRRRRTLGRLPQVRHSAQDHREHAGPHRQLPPGKAPSISHPPRSAVRLRQRLPTCRFCQLMRLSGSCRTLISSSGRAICLRTTSGTSRARIICTC